MMRADLSRVTFDEQKQYAGVVLQQGRVLLDADFNEQVDISRHRQQTLTRDALGRTGVSRDGGGFEVKAAGPDLVISPGRIYVDGLAIDNTPQTTSAVAGSATSLLLATTTLDAREVAVGQLLVVGDNAAAPLTVTAVSGALVTFASAHGVVDATTVQVRRQVSANAQPFSPFGSVVTATPGRYVAVVRAVVAEASQVDEPAMPEPALGGPDTSVRQRVVWQVRLEHVGAVGVGGCEQWKAPVRSGTLRPVLTAAAPGTADCALPADAAVQVTENSLYRIEVNGVDPITGVITSLLWDRDNASTVSLVEDLGPTVTLENFGNDDVRGFGDGQTVTISDQYAEWGTTAAQVCTTSSPAAAERTLQLSPPPVGIDPKARPRLRRWSGQVSAVAPGAEVPLELGLSVVVNSPTVGDYWLVPVRTALGGTGAIDWPRDTVDQYRAEPVRGVEEHWSPLAVLDYDGAVFTDVADCRKTFPALTAITALDVGYDSSASGLSATTVQEAIDELGGHGAGCTVMVTAGDQWAAPLLALPLGSDARICFGSGPFTAPTRTTLRGTGHLFLEGIGAASHVRATADEVALQLIGWASVTVRDIAFSGTSADGGTTGGLMGALSIIDSPQVRIETVVAACASGASRRATCVTIAGPAAGSTPGLADGSTLPTRVVVRDCMLATGEYQVGLVVRDFTYVDVSGVVVTAPDTTRFTSLDTTPRVLRARLSKLIATGLTVPAGGGPPAPPQTRLFAGTSTKVISAGPLVFRTPGPLAQAWRDILVARPVPASATQARKHVLKLTDQALRTTATADLNPVRTLVQGFLAARRPVISQGILVAGAHLGRVNVEDNTISRAIQGITVAVSQSGPGPAVSVDATVVRGNVVNVLVPTESARLRHGIFVGNSRSVLVADNLVALTMQAINDRVPTDGIRVWGVLGNDAQIRDNHITNFPVGIRMTVLDPGNVTSGQKAVRWVIRDNMTDGTTVSVLHNEPNNGKRIRVIDNIPPV